MADADPNSVDLNDPVRHASDAARARAIARMREAMRQQATMPEPRPAAEVKVVVEKEERLTTNDNRDLIETLRRNKRHILAKVKVYSPFRTYFDGEASSISAANQTGPFDILPGHKNFLTLLTQCEITIRAEIGVQRITIERGVMHVRNNNVFVFLDV